MMKIQNLAVQAKSLWSLGVEPTLDTSSNMLKIYCNNEQTPQVCDWLFTQLGYHFAGLIVKENSLCELCYLFVGEKTKGYVEVITDALFDTKSFNSISSLVHAADWYEREAEDLYGIYFRNHPRLGDFILHDDVWQENVKPMRKNFVQKTALLNRKPKEHWHPRKIVEESGAFIMTVGPIFSGEAESVNLQLETIGEE
ncbi:MAG: NADH-quinone oxidoreductase subunit C, partial [Epsilonproteobacteria bacterium]|nr:NADH-quinone oxidoreductase subunit C [Campylobacterota bacterium]